MQKAGGVGTLCRKYSRVPSEVCQLRFRLSQRPTPLTEQLLSKVTLPWSHMSINFLFEIRCWPSVPRTAGDS